MRLTLALALAALPSAALAGPPALDFAVAAVETGARVEERGRIGFPVAPFGGAGVPMRMAEGRLELRAWRLEGTRDSTLALMEPLALQLEAAGYRVVFECEARTCGGFDFRYGMEVLPEPEMHVDLGDFRYLLAAQRSGALVNLLVSRALDQGFVQMTSIDPVAPGAEPVAPVTSAPVTPGEKATEAEAPLEQAAATPEPEPQALPAPPPMPGSLAEALATRGSAPLDDLVFASGKAALEAGDYASLRELADWLKANPDVRVTLVGHTDATGSLEGNTALSRARAQAVRAWLIETLGADAARIDAQGAGYLAPRASNQTPEGRQANRRVEVMVTSVAVD